MTIERGETCPSGAQRCPELHTGLPGWIPGRLRPRLRRGEAAGVLGDVCLAGQISRRRVQLSALPGGPAYPGGGQVMNGGGHDNIPGDRPRHLRDRSGPVQRAGPGWLVAGRGGKRAPGGGAYRLHGHADGGHRQETRPGSAGGGLREDHRNGQAPARAGATGPHTAVETVGCSQPPPLRLDRLPPQYGIGLSAAPGSGPERPLQVGPGPGGGDALPGRGLPWRGCGSRGGTWTRTSSTLWPSAIATSRKGKWGNESWKDGETASGAAFTGPSRSSSRAARAAPWSS